MENEQNTAGEFLQTHRGIILSVTAALAVIVVGIAVFLIVREGFAQKSIAKLDEIAARYETLKPSFADSAETAADSAAQAADSAAEAADSAAEAADNAAQAADSAAQAAAAEPNGKIAEVDALLEEINAFAGSHGGYAGGRAHAMAGDIYAARKKWAEAEQAYLKSASKAGKLFLAPVSYFNAAVCAEEAGKTDDARAHWQKSLGFADFPLAARAQFSLARMLDKAGKTEEAVAAYRLLVEKYEKEAEWTKLAQTRIITLEEKKE